MTSETINIKLPENICLGEKDREYKDILYCPYCGKKMKYHYKIFDHYDTYEWYDCDCNDFNNAEQIIKQIKKLKSNLPKPKFKISYIKKIEEI